ncbi:hypothetical protein BGY98DRAFT_593856 [Russula aff. rugulosa BPL654]|nr:hypothetical protein BGY98DRAFT_593856 [Russula aff. rugulosa BPL654]
MDCGRHFVIRVQKASVGRRPHAPSGLIYHQYTGSTTLASRPWPSVNPLPSSLFSTIPDNASQSSQWRRCGIKFSELDRRVYSPSPTLSISGAPEPALEPSPYCRQPVSQSLCLPGYSPLPRRASTFLVTGCSTSGYTLGAATRLQDFRALIGDLKATFLHRDSKEKFDTGDCAAADDDEERERLHQFLEDVIRKVQ